MITIGKAHLDLRASDEEFAFRLYGRWDSFCRTAFEKVMEDTLSVYDPEEEVIRVESLMVELEPIPEEEFYERFPQLLAERLREVFLAYLQEQERYPVEIVPLRQNNLQALVFFLLRGYFPLQISREWKILPRLFRDVLREEGETLVYYLKRCPQQQLVRKRLVWQFGDEELEALVQVAEPSEALFINLYVRYLCLSRQQMERPEITATDYRDAVWEVVLAYLLFEGRSFFSRRQMVEQTIRGLAARFNVEYLRLLRLLVSGLEKFREEWLFVPELLVILADIREAWDQELPEKPLRIPELLAGEEAPTGEQRNMLRRLLASPESCHRILMSLTEEATEKLVRYLIPEESAFIIRYARELEQEKERGMLEGQAGGEFRLLKWEFIFEVMLAMPSAVFQRTRFVWGVICRLEAHYNLRPGLLLSYLWADQEFLPAALTEVLQELYRQQEADMLRKARQADLAVPGGTEDRLIQVLSHPLTARAFLAALTEKQIRRLVETVAPAEAAFVIRYALVLDKEKERGMLEGRAGSEFRLLKWELIFSVLVCAPAAYLARKQFVRTVLCGLAAHYNVEAIALICYFYRALLRHESLGPEGLETIIGELWEEEVMVDSRLVSGRREAFEAGFVLLREHPESRHWQSAGIFFFRDLLMNYAEPEKAAFIRRYKEEIARQLTINLSGWKQVSKVLADTRGLLAFLVEVYGRDHLIAVFAEAGTEVRQWLLSAGLGEFADFLALTEPEMKLWLNNNPAEIVRLWGKASPAMRRHLFQRLNACPELGKLWLARIGGVSLRQAWDVLSALSVRLPSCVREQDWMNWLYRYTSPEYANLSFPEIRFRLLREIRAKLSSADQEKIWEAARHIPFLKEWAEKKEIQKHNPWIMKKEEETNRFYVSNAGIVLLIPFLPRLFKMLDYIQVIDFAGEEKRQRAVHLLHYLIYEEKECAEPDLILNKLLTATPLTAPVPRQLLLNDEEKQLGLSLLEGVMQNWKVMQHTSLEGFRNSFLIREGILQETAESWQLTVEQKGYDVLLDTLPWSFSLTRMAWMKKTLHVKWRN